MAPARSLLLIVFGLLLALPTHAVRRGGIHLRASEDKSIPYEESISSARDGRNIRPFVKRDPDGLWQQTRTAMDAGDKPQAFRLASILLASGLELPFQGDAQALRDQLLAEDPALEPDGQLRRLAAEVQWLSAQQRIDAGRTSAAIRTLTDLAKLWPDSPRAGQALERKGDLLAQNEKWTDAFESYKAVLDGGLSQTEVPTLLNKMLGIAEKLEKKTYAILFGLNHYTRPEDAIPLYQELIDVAPRWERVPEIQYRIGHIHLENKKYPEAIAALDVVVQRYPRSSWVAAASYDQCLALVSLAKKNKSDVRSLRNAWTALTVFLETYPDSPLAAEAFAHQQRLHGELAEVFYRRALFYDERTDNVSAALSAYRSLLQQFPNSPWTETAKDRIEALTAEQNEDS